MKFTFAIFKEGEHLKTLVMDRSPLVVGRNSDCAIQLDSRTVSRKHCEIKVKRIGLTIKDLGSRNGTIVNGKAIAPGTRVVIQGADLIEIGKFTLRIGKAGSEKSQAGDVEGQESVLAKKQDLLANLEAFIRERIDADVSMSVEDSDQATPIESAPKVAWVEMKASTNLKETIAEAISDTAPPQDESATNETTVMLAKSSDSLEDAAESRRLEMRKRIESMKAKDSKEAADRALKKLFGG